MVEDWKYEAGGIFKKLRMMRAAQLAGCQQMQLPLQSSQPWLACSRIISMTGGCSCNS